LELVIGEIIEQIEMLLKNIISEIMRFIEQNLGIFDQILRIMRDFLLWLEGLVTF